MTDVYYANVSFYDAYNRIIDEFMLGNRYALQYMFEKDGGT